MKDFNGMAILANYFRGIEAVGGKLYFDETGMTFKSHKLNIQTGNTRIEYRDIQEISKRNTLGIVPNGMAVITRDGYEHKFVIYNRKEVIRFLQNKLI